ncbi:MAG: GNAT family N-acetyltransferase [Flavitalea sp.]
MSINQVASFTIENVTNTDHQELILLWEDSVRATHDFLTDEDIQFYRDLILNQYFDIVQLKCVKDEQGSIVGFLGTSGEKIEMLFIKPELRGKGIGKALLRYATEELKIRYVDVNEQNLQAVDFYYASGFVLEKRSPVDGMGKPYPVLHLQKPV